VEIHILTPMIATPVRVAVMVFVDLLKKLTSYFLDSFINNFRNL